MENIEIKTSWDYSSIIIKPLNKNIITEVRILNSQGDLIERYDKLTLEKMRIIELPLENVETGFYYIVVYADKIYNYKMIKKIVE